MWVSCRLICLNNPFPAACFLGTRQKKCLDLARSPRYPICLVSALNENCSNVILICDRGKLGENVATIKLIELMLEVSDPPLQGYF